MKLNYDEMFKINYEELQDVWTIPAVQMNEKKNLYKWLIVDFLEKLLIFNYKLP